MALPDTSLSVCALVVASATSACSWVVDGRLADATSVDAGASDAVVDPSLFPESECSATTTNAGGALVVGPDPAGSDDTFAPFSDSGDTVWTLQDIDDATWGVLSLRSNGLALADLCIEMRVEVEESNAPAELVSFRRLVVALDAGSEGGELGGVTTRFVNADDARGKHVKITVAAADTDGVSTTAIAHAVVR